MEHRDVFTLEQIVEYCERIQQIVAERGNNFEKFATDIDYQDLCAFRLEHIGDFVSSLSAQFKDAHPEVEWNKIVGMRNILAHDYGSMDLEIVWSAIEQDVPKLLDFCKRIIK